MCQYTQSSCLFLEPTGDTAEHRVPIPEHHFPQALHMDSDSVLFQCLLHSKVLCTHLVNLFILDPKFFQQSGHIFLSYSWQKLTDMPDITGFSTISVLFFPSTCSKAYGPSYCSCFCSFAADPERIRMSENNKNLCVMALKVSDNSSPDHCKPPCSSYEGNCGQENKSPHENFS